MVKEKNKIDYVQPKSVDEAIDDCCEFLECDLWTKFCPVEVIIINKKKTKYKRKDYFKSEKDMINYLRCHFDILKKEIKSIPTINLVNKREIKNGKRKR